jgi:hypothetical protein
MLRRLGGLAGALVLLIATGAHAATIVLPSRYGYTIVIDAKGNAIPFTVAAAGETPGASVTVEQCDGVPASTAGWTPVEHCDSATAPASQTVDSNGTVRFAAGDTNFGFTPFAGESPQHLFNCIAVGQPAPNNKKPSFTTCQLRIAASVTEASGADAFLPIHVSPPGQTEATFPITTSTTPRSRSKSHSGGASRATTTTPSTVALDPNAPIARVAAPGTPSTSSSKSAIDRLGDAIFSVPGLIFIAIWVVLAAALYRRARRNRVPAAGS